MRTLEWVETPPATAGVAAEPPCVREKELTGGTSPSATFREREGKQRARAASARAELEWAGLRAEFRPLTAVLFFFLSMQFLFYI